MSPGKKIPTKKPPKKHLIGLRFSNSLFIFVIWGGLGHLKVTAVSVALVHLCGYLVSAAVFPWKTAPACCCNTTFLGSQLHSFSIWKYFLKHRTYRAACRWNSPTEMEQMLLSPLNGAVKKKKKRLLTEVCHFPLSTLGSWCQNKMLVVIKWIQMFCLGKF